MENNNINNNNINNQNLNLDSQPKKDFVIKPKSLSPNIQFLNIVKGDKDKHHKPIIQNAVEKYHDYNERITLLFSDIPKEHRFWIINTVPISSLKELYESLKGMTDLVYNHHVTKEKNDFSAWIYNVYHDTDLAVKLYHSKTKEEAIAAIEKRIDILSPKPKEDTNEKNFFKNLIKRLSTQNKELEHELKKQKEMLDKKQRELEIWDAKNIDHEKVLFRRFSNIEQKEKELMQKFEQMQKQETKLNDAIIREKKQIEEQTKALMGEKKIILEQSTNLRNQQDYFKNQEMVQKQNMHQNQKPHEVRSTNNQMGSGRVLTPSSMLEPKPAKIQPKQLIDKFSDGKIELKNPLDSSSQNQSKSVVQNKPDLSQTDLSQVHSYVHSHPSAQGSSQVHSHVHSHPSVQGLSQVHSHAPVSPDSDLSLAHAHNQPSNVNLDHLSKRLNELIAMLIHSINEKDFKAAKEVMGKVRYYYDQLPDNHEHKKAYFEKLVKIKETLSKALQ